MTSSPPPPPPSTSSPSLSALALAAGLVAALIAVDDPPGINVVIVAALMGAGVLAVARDRMSPVDWAFGIAGFAFISMFAVRTSEWVLLADLCAAAGLASLAMSGGESWPAVIRGGFAVLGRLYRSLGPILAPLRARWRGIGRVAGAPLLRGSVVGSLLAVVFGVLFASADPAFAQIARDLFVPSWDVGLLPARFFAALVTVCFTGAYALVATEGPSQRFSTWASIHRTVRAPRRLQVAEWAIPIALLDLVFVAFVVVQIAVLFGGQQHVLDTAGLTYAQYARSGFFQLVGIATLVLGVIACTVRFADSRTDRDRTLLRILLGVLCVLTLVVLVSALRRLGLYEDTYGFTRLRFIVHVAIFWLSAVLISVMVAGTRRQARWLPRTLVAMTAVMLFIVNVINPDGFIAGRNIERYEATGKIDLGYLSSLGADATPALMALPAHLRACVLDRQPAPEDAPWWSFNLSRARARSAVASLPDGSAVCRP